MALTTPALEIFNSEWKNVKDILEQLDDLFICEVCGSPVNNPYTLGGCEHFFCKSCVEDVAGSKCPVCQIPSHAKDVQPNRQIANAVAICNKIKILVNTTGGQSGDFELTPERNSTIEAPSSSFYVEYTLNDFPASSPISSRTRGIDHKMPVRKTPTLRNSGGPSTTTAARKTKQPKTQVKNGKASASLKNSVTPVNTTGHRDVSDDEISENQTLNTARKKMIRTTRRKEWALVDSQDEEKENTTTRKVASKQQTRGTPRPSTSTAPQVNSDNEVPQRTPVQPSSRRRSATPSSGASTGRKKRDRKSGASSDLCLTPSIRGTPKNRSFISSPATPSSKTKKNAKGETPLHVAAIKGDVQRVQELLSEGASPNVKDNAGWTPLHEAVNHGFVEIATLLIDHGALINVPGMDNDTPLHDAVMNNRIECVKLLVSKGANTMARNIYGRTPVDVATRREIRSLLKSTAAVTSDQPDDEAEAAMEINQVVVVATGLSREQKIKLQKCCNLLHWKLVDDFQPEVTHVVSSVNKDGMCPRTMKYLNAILTGKWIVNFEWVEMCIGFKQRVCEEAFEVPGTSTCPDSHAPVRARKNFQKQCPGLLDGCHFYLQGEFSYPTPEKEELQKLIKTGGGCLVTREIKSDMLEESEVIVPYHVDKNSRVSHFIIHDRKNSEPHLISPRLASVPVSWLLDSIAQFKLIPIPV